MEGEQLGLHGGVREALGEGEAVEEGRGGGAVELTGGQGHGSVDDDPGEQVGLQLVPCHKLLEVVLGPGGTLGLGVLGDNNLMGGHGGPGGQGRGGRGTRGLDAGLP